MGKKVFWRCIICGDLHYGVKPPEKCPTCGQSSDKAIEISREEFLKNIVE